MDSPGLFNLFGNIQLIFVKSPDGFILDTDENQEKIGLLDADCWMSRLQRKFLINDFGWNN